MIPCALHKTFKEIISCGSNFIGKTYFGPELIQVLLLLVKFYTSLKRNIDVKQTLFSPVCEKKRSRLKIH